MPKRGSTGKVPVNLLANLYTEKKKGLVNLFTAKGKKKQQLQ